MENRETLLKIENLNVYFKTENGRIQAVKDVSFEIGKGELVALVGESGCGKSITSLSIMGLTPRNCQVEAGSISLGGQELTAMSPDELRKLRGKDLAMIFQEPLTSLNPLFTIGYQLTETIRIHNQIGKKEAKERAIDLLKKVEIPRPESILKEYPNALSGGMRQRVMIAIAMANNPTLLIADEPTTALDVTIQAQILRLMRQLMKEYSASILFITHDLGVVAEIADRVIVMYAGQIVEQGEVFSLFRQPLHPYTQGLMSSTIKINQSDEILGTINGVVPNLSSMPEGCRFHPRCPYAREDCRKNMPELNTVTENRYVRCLHWNELGGEQNG